MLAVHAALGLALAAPPVLPLSREADLVEVPPQRPGDAPGGDAPGGDAPADAPGGDARGGDAPGGEGWDFNFDELGSGFGNDAQVPAAGKASPEAPASPAKPTTDAGEPPRKLRRPRVAVGDVLGGNLRLTGAYLHFDDEPALFPAGDDALGLASGRVTVDAKPGKRIALSLHGFVDLTRSPGGTIGGAFTSPGATVSAYRTRYLGWTFWQNGAVRGAMGLDRAAMSVTAGPIKIDLGRFPVNYSVTNLYAPNDFYAPFSATAVNRLYKPGVDALRVSAAAGPLTTVDLVGVLGYDATSGVPTWGRTSVLSRVRFVGGGFEWGILGGKLAERWAVGGSAQGNAGPIGLRGEFHVGFPDRDGRGRGADDLPIYVRAAGGPSVSFAWRNANLGAEYMFISDGSKKASGYAPRALGLYSDTVPFLARHYVSASFGLDLVPILKAQTFTLVNASDGSGLAGLSLFYNVANESDLILGLFAPWGRGFRGFDPMTMLPQIGSEYGLSPLVVYLESRVFF